MWVVQYTQCKLRNMYGRWTKTMCQQCYCVEQRMFLQVSGLTMALCGVRVEAQMLMNDSECVHRTVIVKE